MISPFTPHMAEELWEMLGHSGGIVAAGWPSFNEAVAKAEEIVVPVQVNGKVRARLTVPADIIRRTTPRAGAGGSSGRQIPRREDGQKIVVAGGRLVSIVVV